MPNPSSNADCAKARSRLIQTLGVIMEIGSVKDIPCPFCGKALFRKELKQHGGGGAEIWLNTEDRPAIESDEKGNFITCSHCSRRVVMLPDPTYYGQFYIAPDQR